LRTQFVMSELAIGLRRNVTMTVAAIVTIWISVTLLGGALMMRGGADSLQKDVLNQLEVSVYLKPPCGSPNAPSSCLTPADQASIQRTLQGLPQVQSITYISQAEALQRFKDEFPDDPALTTLASGGGLPASFAVKLKDPREFDVVSSAVGAAPGVDEVVNAQHVFDELFHIFHIVEIVVLVIMLVSLAAAILLIYNAMLVAAFSRRRETGIMRLVGASDFYIQAPFILEGTVIGIVGTGLALSSLTVLRLLTEGVTRKSPLFAPFGHLSILLHAFPAMIAVGVLLPAVASFVTLQRHMRV
jgi:cell division transport system permease protein